MSLAASVTVSNRMMKWLYRTEFLLPNSYQVNPLGYLMCISLTSWKDGIIQLMPGGLVMFYSSLIHILGRKWVTLDEGFDTTYSWKLCVWMGQDEAECHRVGNAPSCAHSHVHSALCSFHIDPWGIGSAANSAEKWRVRVCVCMCVYVCVPKLQFMAKCQTIILMWSLLSPWKRLDAKSDYQAQIMVITIMIIYYLLCAWQCARCISSFNPPNITWVDIYNL